MKFNTKGLFWAGKLAGGLCLFTAVLLAGLSAGAQDSPPEAGLLIRLSGEATYSNEAVKKKPAKAIAFMKILKGDRFELKADARVTFLYFASGRQETWNGPALLKVGQEKTTPEMVKGQSRSLKSKRCQLLLHK